MFSPESSIKWATRYEDMCGGGGVEWSEEAEETKQCWLCHCQKDTSWMFHPFVWKRAEVMSEGGVSLRPESFYSMTTRGGRPHLARPRVWRERPRALSRINVGLHALNGCGPWWIPSPDALSMRPALCIIAPAQTKKALSSISPFSASLN